jgi:hypothetical protein
MIQKEINNNPREVFRWRLLPGRPGRANDARAFCPPAMDGGPVSGMVSPLGQP